MSIEARTHARRARARRLTGLVVMALACTGQSEMSALAGVYRDISESEWMTELRLDPDGSAVIEQSVWAPGDWENRQVTTTPARWSVAGSNVVVTYGERVDTLAYSDAWNTVEFGLPGSGPGLRPITASDSSAFVGRVVLWRAEFVDSFQAPLR